MPNFAAAFKTEVTRLARKAIREQIGATKKASGQHRHQIAQLRRQVAMLQKKVAFLEEREKKRLTKPPAAEAAKGVRFSAKWVKRHRNKLGLSAAHYSRLVGVSAMTIYNWERGHSKPRAKQLAAWAAIRGIGKREAQRRLEVIDPTRTSTAESGGDEEE